MSVYKCHGLTRKDIKYGNKDDIRAFLDRNQDYLRGRVLDFGAGLQPYKKLCGDYFPFDPKYEYSSIPDGNFDAVLVTQVLQFVDDPSHTLRYLQNKARGGYLVATYSANWYEVEPDDTWRITRLGMERLVRGAVLVHEPISRIKFDDFIMNLVYGLVCHNPD